MPSNPSLTEEMLDALESSILDADDPLAIAAQLLLAVEEDGLANPADQGRALVLAAKIYEVTGDLPRAEELATRAVQADQEHDVEDPTAAVAYRAGLWLWSGRKDEALADLAAMRPALTRDPYVVGHLCEAMVVGGQAELAHDWVTASLKSMLPEPGAPEVGAEQSRSGDANRSMTLFMLAHQRSLLRQDLNLPYDNYDELADMLHDEIHHLLADKPEECPFCGEEDLEDEDFDEEDLEEEAAMLFWPQAQFERLVQQWPRLALSFGGSWDEHRAQIEYGMTQLSASSAAGLAILPGAVDDLEAYAADVWMGPVDLDCCEDYTEELTTEISWPPTRNAPCWCGSGLKYKKCCLHRTPHTLQSAPGVTP